MTNLLHILRDLQIIHFIMNRIKFSEDETDKIKSMKIFVKMERCNDDYESYFQK